MGYRQVSYPEQVWYILRYFLMEGGKNKMPKKPKRPCSYPGCPELTDGRFCEKHEKQENKRYEKYDRDPAVRRRYGRAWKRIRDSYVQQHPLCELCQEKGLLVPSRRSPPQGPSLGRRHTCER